MLVAAGAIVAPSLHIVSDLMELAQGFSATQLVLNYLAFVAMPFIVMGLHVIQAPRGGALSLVGALSYGASFIYFAGTTTYALVRKTPDYDSLLAELGPLYTIHGALMVAGGVMFGVSVVRTRVLPAWTGVTLVLGVIVNLLLVLGAFPPIAQIGGSLIRNVALVGMGVSLIHKKVPKLRSFAREYPTVDGP